MKVCGPHPVGVYFDSAALFIAFSAALVAPTHAAEKSYAIVTGLALQEKLLEYKQNNNVIDARQTTINYSVGAAIGRGYVLLEVDHPINQSESTETANNGGSLLEYQVERKDYGLTLGYNLWRGLGVFGGYKIGETDIKVLQTNSSPVAFYSWLYNYREEGFFAGGSYGFDFGSRGLLSLSIAYAHYPTRRTANFGALESYIDGTVSGNSYGIKWSGTLAGRVDYVVGYKLQLYRFRDETTNPPLPPTDIDQNYRIFYVGISRAF